MSESSLHRHFRKQFGTTPARFANQLRIAEAKRHLRQGDEPLEELSFRLGFADASHFSRVFRKNTGESPAEYRRRRQRPPNMRDW
jgi:AraC-like DNA-binding protein